MTKKSSAVLFDTVIIVSAHEYGVWEILCNAYKVAIPEIVFEDEAFYFESRQGNKRPLKPSQWISEKKAVKVAASIEDYERLRCILSDDLLNSLDSGELEALALLLCSSEYGFTTADKAAIRTLGVLGLGERGVSMEKLLLGAGAPKSTIKKLARHFTEAWFKDCLHDGFVERDLYLRKPGKNPARSLRM